MMLTRAYTQASDNSPELTGRTKASTQEIVEEAIGILRGGIDETLTDLVHLETKYLCDEQSKPEPCYVDILRYVLQRLAVILKARFTKSGGKVSACIHEIKRREDRLFFPATFDLNKLNLYMGVSLRIVPTFSGNRKDNESEYDSLFCTHSEDSCFSSKVMDELKKRGVILKTERHIERKSGVSYTLFFPKEVQTIQ